jgi:hypothetical protein
MASKVQTLIADKTTQQNFLFFFFSTQAHRMGQALFQPKQKTKNKKQKKSKIKKVKNKTKQNETKSHLRYKTSKKIRHMKYKKDW